MESKISITKAVPVQATGKCYVGIDDNSPKYSFINNCSMPANVYTLAKAFLSISSMTHKKLQKLCYYAKAWHLALYDENLISEQFQAWVHGAVQPALYSSYKKYGFDIIPMEESKTGIPEAFISFANEIYQAYGHLTGDQLEAINHTEEPWLKARVGYKPWEKCTNEISEEDMKLYYRSMMHE